MLYKNNLTPLGNTHTKHLPNFKKNYLPCVTASSSIFRTSGMAVNFEIQEEQLSNEVRTTWIRWIVCQIPLEGTPEK